MLGGFGGGPWLDGRMRMANAAIGYAASAIDDPPDTYANVAADRPRRDHRATPTTCAAARQIRAASRSRTREPARPARREDLHAHAAVDGIATRYEVTGDGPPLLMFSPGGFDSTLESGGPSASTAAWTCWRS